jgi:hypothetical protein
MTCLLSDGGSSLQDWRISRISFVRYKYADEAQKATERSDGGPHVLLNLGVYFVNIWLTFSEEYYWRAWNVVHLVL